jgi:limonene-1,2-epoxide hydrolase
MRGTPSGGADLPPFAGAWPVGPSVAPKRAQCQAVLGRSQMPIALETVQDFIAAFVRAWPNADTTTLGSFFSEAATYHNVPVEPVRGRAAIEATFAQFMAIGGRVNVEIIHMVAEGPIVMTERVDHPTRADGITASLPMTGSSKSTMA